MKYLNHESLNQLGVDWESTIKCIQRATLAVAEGSFVQPVKPYLRYKNLENRIIAMPAFIGNEFDVAGIKWISSFPSNISKGIPRAHSVVVLNNSETGEPICIINTPLLSIVRTASVSGLMIQKYLKSLKRKNLKVGIVGYGPIGQYHYKMLQEYFSSFISEFSIFDLKKISDANYNSDNTHIVHKWEEAYIDSDIFITCTVSKERYIDLKPKIGSLQLNVSLRDYKPVIFEQIKDSIIVDNWEEICRENTDVEIMHKKCGLREEDTSTICDVVQGNIIRKLVEDRKTIMFNPMGMAVFDMSIARYYFDLSNDKKVGTIL